MKIIVWDFFNSVMLPHEIKPWYQTNFVKEVVFFHFLSVKDKYWLLMSAYDLAHETIWECQHLFYGRNYSKNIGRLYKYCVFALTLSNGLTSHFLFYNDVIIVYTPNRIAINSSTATNTVKKQLKNFIMSLSVYISSLINDGFSNFILAHLPDSIDVFSSDWNVIAIDII